MHIHLPEVLEARHQRHTQTGIPPFIACRSPFSVGALINLERVHFQILSFGVRLCVSENP